MKASVSRRQSHHDGETGVTRVIKPRTIRWAWNVVRILVKRNL